MIIRLLKKKFWISALFLGGCAFVHAGEINKTFLSVAIDGYDTSAYFTENKPREGEKTYTFEWKEATWRFATKEGRDKFATNPEKYAPQYGGHCANAISLGHKVKGDPGIWRMIDDKLYLFYAERGRKRWASNVKQWIKDADENWKKLKDK